MPDSTTPSTATFPEQMHAYNPVTEPQLFSAVIRKRCVAFLVDAVMIAVLTLIAFVFVAVLGVLTLGLGWLLFGMVFPIVALAYNAFTIGGPKSSTIGQRMMGLAVPMWYGGKVTPLIAAFHALLFWFSPRHPRVWMGHPRGPRAWNGDRHPTDPRPGGAHRGLRALVDRQ